MYRTVKAGNAAIRDIGAVGGIEAVVRGVLTVISVMFSVVCITMTPWFVKSYHPLYVFIWMVFTCSVIGFTSYHLNADEPDGRKKTWRDGWSALLFYLSALSAPLWIPAYDFIYTATIWYMLMFFVIIDAVVREFTDDERKRLRRMGTDENQ